MRNLKDTIVETPEKLQRENINQSRQLAQEKSQDVMTLEELFRILRRKMDYLEGYADSEDSKYLRNLGYDIRKLLNLCEKGGFQRENTNE